MFVICEKVQSKMKFIRNDTYWKVCEAWNVSVALPHGCFGWCLMCGWCTNSRANGFCYGCQRLILCEGLVLIDMFHSEVDVDLVCVFGTDAHECNGLWVDCPILNIWLTWFWVHQFSLIHDQEKRYFFWFWYSWNVERFLSDRSEFFFIMYA